jgi:hypothetical protein
LYGGIGDHDSGDIEDPVQDLCGLVEDIYANEGEQPDRDEDGHHVNHGIAKERDFKDSIFEGFELSLGWLFIAEGYLS